MDVAQNDHRSVLGVELGKDRQDIPVGAVHHRGSHARAARRSTIRAGRPASVSSRSPERVRWATGRVLRRVAAPYGSFELDTSGPYVITSSLLRGTLAIYDRRLHLLPVRRVATSARDVTGFAP